MKQKHFILLLWFSIGLIGNALAQAPANDECSGAILITTVPFGSACSTSVNGSTLNSTKSSPNPSCTGVENDDDVWYKFVANSQSIVLRFGTVINLGTGNQGTAGAALYGQNCPTTTATLLCNNLASAGNGYTIINGLAIGDTYYLRFWSVLSSGNPISFEFCVQEMPPAPANDECANATLITTEPEGTNCNGTISASTVSSTHSSPDPPCQPAFSNDDIWYRFVAVTNAVRFNFSNAILPLTNSGIANVSVTLYEANCPTGTTGMICNSNIGANSGSALLGGLTPGNTYYLRLYSFAANNYMNLNFCVVDVTLPANDECLNSIPLTVSNGFCVSPGFGNLRNATASQGFGTPSCVSLLTGEDVWYSVIIPAGGSVVVQTSPVDNNVNDLVMEAFAGNCGALTQVGCNDDGNPDPSDASFHARIELSGRTPGERILLRVVPKGSINRGPFAICAWDPLVLPPVAAGGNCINIPPVIIDSAHGNRYIRVPLFDANGNIVATIFPNGFSLNTINASVFVNETGSVRSANNHFYLDRNIAITASGFGTFRVRIYIKDSELNALKAADPSVAGSSDLRITKTSTGCQSLFSGSPILIQQDSSSAYGSDHYIEFSTATFSSFYLAGGLGALPLRFISFQVEPGNSGNLLSWSVEKENAIKFFYIEQSQDSRHFKSIDSLSKNDFIIVSSTEWKYEYTDKAPYNGNVYYRIRMVDVNGIEKYSSVQVVSKSNIVLGRISIFPNPASHLITIMPDKVYGQCEYIIYNAKGARVNKGSLILLQNSSSTINIHGLSNGSYLLTIRNTNENTVQTFKFIKD